MLQRANAIFTALLIVTYMCFPVFSVFAEDAEADTFAMSEVSAATDGTTATDGITAAYGTFDSPQDGDVVASFEALAAWLGDNKNSGKTVTFSDTIIIPANESIWMYGVTLDTANHGLVIAGTTRLVGVTIIGESTKKPVITIAKDGHLEIREKQSEIISGGTAVKIESDGKFEVLRTGWCSISADAVGIEAEGGLNLSDTSIISSGTGISSGGDVELFLCDIEAPNPIKTTGTVILDNCFVSKEIADAIVKSGGTLDTNSENNLQKMLPLGKALPPDLFDDELTITIIFDNGKERDIPVLWNIPVIDTSKEDKYEVKGTIRAPYDRLPLPLTASIEIVDASLPVLYDTAVVRVGFTPYYAFYFLYEADDSNRLTIWRTDDEGANWYDYTKDAAMNFDDDPPRLLFGIDQVQPVQLVFKVEGLGESQILRITFDGGVRTDIGGDRNGGDRGPNTLPNTTTPTEPPPDTTPPKSSTTSRERTSTTYDKSYEPAETENSNEISEPVTGSEIPEIITGNEQSAPSTATGEASPSQSPSQPYTEAAADTPEEQDTAAPDAEAEQFEAVPTAAMQDVADVPIAEPADYTENTQGSKPLSDTVIPIVAVSTVGLLGAGTYLGVAGKLSLHSLIKMFAGWLGI